MAEASRVLIGLVCGLFILSVIPHSTAQEEINLDGLVLEFDNQFQQWYEVGEILEISPSLIIMVMKSRFQMTLLVGHILLSKTLK